MDWIQTLTIIITMAGLFIAGFFYISQEIKELRNDIGKVKEELRNDIGKVKEDVLWIKFQHGHVPENMKTEVKEN